MTARWLVPAIGRGHLRWVASRAGAVPVDAVGQLWATVPDDPEVRAAERAGGAPLDACPDSPAVRAVGAIAERLLEGEAQPG